MKDASGREDRYTPSRISSVVQGLLPHHYSEHYCSLFAPATKLLLIPYKPAMYTWIVGVLRERGFKIFSLSLPYTRKSRESWDWTLNMKVLVKRFIHLDFPCCKIQNPSVPRCHFQARIPYSSTYYMESEAQSSIHTWTCSIPTISSHTKSPPWLFRHLHIVKI